MAEKVIGVDVGTNAVRAAEVALGATPRLLRFGQVGLPPGAVVEGEVADPAAVAEALKRLWKEVGFRSKSVRVGIASARVILRMVEMPELSEEDTRSAISLELGEYVPMAPESTVFGFQPVAGPDGWAADAGTGEGADLLPETDGRDGPGGGNGASGRKGAGDDDRAGGAAEGGLGGRQQRLLLAAAHRDAVTPLVEAVQQAGLKVAAVDAVPAALARALAPPPSDGIGPRPVDAIVSLGAGTTLVVVAQGGTPLFSRTMTNVSGRQTTERLADRLALTVPEAERVKRLAGAGSGPAPAPAGAVAPPCRVGMNGSAGHDEAPAPAPVEINLDALEPDVLDATSPLVAELVAEVADSLDYYASQPGALTVDRVLLTGGGMHLSGASELLSQRLGLPVMAADLFERVEGVPAGFEPVDLPFLAPYLAAPVGIALGGGRSKVTRIDLLPTERKVAGRGKLPLVVGAVAAVLLLAGGALWWQRRGAIASEEQATESARQDASQLVAAAGDPLAGVTTGPDPAEVLKAALAVDPDWLAALSRLDEIHASLGVSIVTLQGTMTAPAAPAAAASGGSTTTTAAPTTTSTAAPTAAPGGAAGSNPTPAAPGTVDPVTGAVVGAKLGTMTLTAAAPDLAAVAAWLEAIEADPRFGSPTVSGVASQVGSGGATGLQFTAELELSGENLVPRTVREPQR